jgi:hypothetical protein
VLEAATHAPTRTHAHKKRRCCRPAAHAFAAKHTAHARVRGRTQAGHTHQDPAPPPPRSYRNTLALLGAAGVSAVAPDWPGHGDSAKPAPSAFGYDEASYVSALGAFVAAIDIRKPLALVVQASLAPGAFWGAEGALRPWLKVGTRPGCGRRSRSWGSRALPSRQPA